MRLLGNQQRHCTECWADRRTVVCKKYVMLKHATPPQLSRPSSVLNLQTWKLRWAPYLSARKHISILNYSLKILLSFSEILPPSLICEKWKWKVTTRGNKICFFWVKWPFIHLPPFFDHYLEPGIQPFGGNVFHISISELLNADGKYKKLLVISPFCQMTCSSSTSSSSCPVIMITSPSPCL